MKVNIQSISLKLALNFARWLLVVFTFFSFSSGSVGFFAFGAKGVKVRSVLQTAFLAPVFHPLLLKLLPPRIRVSPRAPLPQNIRTVKRVSSPSRVKPVRRPPLVRKAPKTRKAPSVGSPPKNKISKVVLSNIGLLYLCKTLHYV